MPARPLALDTQMWQMLRYARIRSLAGTFERGVSDPDAEHGRNLTFRLLDSVGRAIVTGAFDHTPFPTEAELTLRHKVSRSVTREAMKMLAAKGLLSAKARHGTVVCPTSSWNLFDPDVLRWMLERPMSLDLLRHFNELRVAVEPEAAALAARVAGPDELAQIDSGLARMAAAEAGDDDPLEADIAFHVAVLNASKNPFYAQLRDVARTALRTSINLTNSLKGTTASLPRHVAVRDAIAARNPDAARDAMRAIIGEVLTAIADASVAAADESA